VTNVALVARKLAVLQDHLRRLEQRRPATPEALRADSLLQDAIAMSVLVVVQEAMDIALHVASDEGWELASTYRDAFVVLARHGIISDELAASLGGAAQLRNRIAHGYASVDADRLWAELPAGVASFGEFSKAMARFIGPSSDEPPAPPG
jgi:uncharacterized protein YutE (UPF0331/DUF86 family)